jgi:regulatory protein
MVITKIERQKKNSSRRSVYLDDAYAFGVSEEVFAAFTLYEGRTLDERERAEIESAEAAHSVRTAAMRFRSFRPRSSREMIDHLVRKGFDRPLIDRTMEYLSSINLLNDEEFARMLCRDRLLLRPVGKEAMKNVLYKKGIAKDIIARVIDEFFTPEQEVELARRDAERKLKRLTSLPPETVKRRLFEHLMRRGYDSSVSRSIVKQLVR